MFLHRERCKEGTIKELCTNENAGREFSDIEKKGLELPIFTFYKIEVATDNFSVANELEEGGFGPVYKVIINFTNDRKWSYMNMSK